MTLQDSAPVKTVEKPAKKRRNGLRNLSVIVAFVLASLTVATFLVIKYNEHSESQAANDMWEAYVPANFTPIATVNVATGQITSYTDNTGAEIFNQNSTLDDEQVAVGAGSTGPFVDPFVPLVSSLTIEGIDYPTNPELTWQVSNDSTQLVSFFNQYMAVSADESVAMLEAHNLYGAVNQFIKNKLEQAAAANQLPVVQYEVTQSVTIYPKKVLADGWKNNLPAWQVQQQLDPNPAEQNYSYQYSKLCTTYQASASTRPVVEVARTLFGSEVAQFSLNRNSKVTVTTESAEPCAIVHGPQQQDLTPNPDMLPPETDLDYSY